MTCCNTTLFTDFHIGLRHPNGGLEEFVIRDTHSRLAIRKAIGGTRTLKVAFCHDAAIYCRDDRGRIAQLRAADHRAAEFHQYADL